MSSASCTPWQAVHDFLVGSIVIAPRTWLGTMSNIDGLKKLTLDEVRAEMDTRFTPANSALTYVGPDPEGVLADLIGDVEGRAPEVSMEVQEEVEPPFEIPTWAVERFKKAKRSMVYYCFHHRPGNVHFGAPIALMCEMLDSGPHALLNTWIRADRKLSYYNGLITHWFNDCNVIMLYAEIDSRSNIQAIEAIHEGVSRLRTDGFTQQQFEESRARLAHTMTAVDDDPEQLCHFIANRHTTTRPPVRSARQVIASLNDTSVDVLNATARSILRPERSLCALVGGIPRFQAGKTRRALKGMMEPADAKAGGDA
jgi:predicted Zn-dependent peptidase